jgi:hypothetical protein
MSRPFLWLALALAAAPAFAFLVYRLARGLGFLEPPIDRQHELRRTISLAIYAFLLFLPVLIYGFEKRWPRAWIFFGIVDGGALLFFAGSGMWAGRELWRIRHPEPSADLPAASVDDALAAAPLAAPSPAGAAVDGKSEGEEPAPPTER